MLKLKAIHKARVFGSRKSTELANSRTATIMSLGPVKPSAAICATMAGICANFVMELAKSAMLGRKIRMLLTMLRTLESLVAVVIVYPFFS
jgi:hypothetical protein